MGPFQNENYKPVNIYFQTWNDVELRAVWKINDVDINIKRKMIAI